MSPAVSSSVQSKLGPSNRALLAKPQYVLAALLALGFALRFGISVVSPSMHYPDEIFQTLEPAHRLAFGPGILTWEFHEGMRSWILPAVFATIMRATAWLGAGSIGYLAGIKAALCLLSLTTIYFAYKFGQRIFGTGAGLLCAGICTFWYQLIYFAPRALSEVVAAHLLLPGIYLAFFASGSKSRRRLFVSGILCAFAFMLRLQLAPAVGITVLYCCRKDWRDRWLPMVSGMVPVILLFGVADWIGWSYPFQSTLLNFSVNLLQHKAAQFGTEPFNFYIRKAINFFGVVLVFTVIGGVVVRRARLLAYTVLAIVIPHSLLAHKELRFIYPATPLILILAGLGIWESARWMTENTRCKALAAAVCVMLIPVALTAITYRRKVDWRYRTGALVAMQQLSHTPDACGVGFRDIDWGDSGGYTYLHRDVPIFITTFETPHIPISGEAEQTIRRWMSFEANQQAFNYVVSEGPLPLTARGYKPVQCWDEICLYKRPGTCKEVSNYSMNELLRLMGK